VDLPVAQADFASQVQVRPRSRQQQSPGHATLMLVLATLFWGLSFPLAKNWQENTADCPGGPITASSTLIGVRTVLALLIFAVFRPSLFRLPTRREFGLGLLLGFANFIGSFCQLLGLSWTTPAVSGFITSLSSAWVPLLIFSCFRIPIARPTLWGICFGIAGAAVLEIDISSGWRIGAGEVLTLVCSIVFAFVILGIDRFGRRIESTHLTVGFVAMTGLPGLLLAPVLASRAQGATAWLSWLGSALSSPVLLVDMVLLTLLCTVLAYLWMATYQPRVPASRAALLYLLEPVFASLFSFAWMYDTLSLRLLLGGGLILFGNLLVEIPRWLRRLRQPRKPDEDEEQT
jgi:drug/metabolite transporter (DMT)-like permease